MSTELEELLKGLKLRQAAEQEELVRLGEKRLPLDYLSFMEKRNGGFGVIGNKSNYIDLWTAQDVLKINPYYEEDFARGVICIGSNGGGTLYGYDPLGRHFFATDVFEFSAAEVDICGHGFADLIRYVSDGEI